MLATSTRSRILSSASTDGTYAADPSVPYIRIVRSPAKSRKQRPAPWTLRDAQCRLLNVMVALIGIALTAPLLALIALAIKLSSPGPVFYTQPRVGLNRRGESDRRGWGTGSRPAEPGRRQGDQAEVSSRSTSSAR